MDKQTFFERHKRIKKIFATFNKVRIFLLSKVLKRPFFCGSSKDLKHYKNSFSGKRCFIVCTGPSLTLEDLHLIKDEISFSMNSIVNKFKETDFRPSFYLIQDGEVEKRIRNQILACKPNNMFVGLSNAYGIANYVISKKTYKKIYGDCGFFTVDTLSVVYDLWYNKKKLNFRISQNPIKKVFDGTTITYSILQLAFFMGFKTVCLLGADGTIGIHFDDNKDNKNAPTALTQIMAYEKAKQYAEQHGISIYNCTRGGKLEVFERKSLEEVLNNNL